MHDLAATLPCPLTPYTNLKSCLVHIDGIPATTQSVKFNKGVSTLYVVSTIAPNDMERFKEIKDLLVHHPIAQRPIMVAPSLASYLPIFYKVIRPVQPTGGHKIDHRNRKSISTSE